MMQRTIPHRQKLTFAPDFLMSSFTKRQPYSAASNLLFAFYFVFIKVSLTITNPRHAVRDSDGSQFAAAGESIVTYFRYGIRNGDGSQTCAMIESLTSYACHAVRDGDGN